MGRVVESTVYRGTGGATEIVEAPSAESVKSSEIVGAVVASDGAVKSRLKSEVM